MKSTSFNISHAAALLHSLNMVVVDIGVISDVVCPVRVFLPWSPKPKIQKVTDDNGGAKWCYIGKRTLEKAISLYQNTYPGGKDDVFSVTWRPYYLNNDDPSSESVDKRELTESRLSGISPERVTAMTQRLSQIGRSVGIDFKYGGRIGGTRDAHRLIHFGQTKSLGVQDALVEKLFEAYHELEMDISSGDILRQIAIGAGLDGPEVEEWLNSDLGRDIVDAEAMENRRMGNSGVPIFVIQDVHRVSGAQDTQEFFETFIRVKEEELRA